MIVQKNPTNNQRYINLPSELCKALGINQGDEIEFTIENRNEFRMSIQRR